MRDMAEVSLVHVLEPDFWLGTLPNVRVGRSQDLRLWAGVKLFNTQWPLTRDSSGALQDPCAHRGRRNEWRCRARDTCLNPEVSIEVSAEVFCDRFEREAALSIAALNHPAISFGSAGVN